MTRLSSNLCSNTMLASVLNAKLLFNGHRVLISYRTWGSKEDSFTVWLYSLRVKLLLRPSGAIRKSPWPGWKAIYVETLASECFNAKLLFNPVRGLISNRTWGSKEEFHCLTVQSEGETILLRPSGAIRKSYSMTRLSSNFALKNSLYSECFNAKLLFNLVIEYLFK